MHWETDKYPNLHGIAVGCFADPEFPAPSVSVWEESLHPWLGLPLDIERIPKVIGADGRPMK